MKITVHSIHFDADKKLIQYIQNKINKLDNYFDRIIDSEVFLRLEKSHTNENKVAEIKLHIPGGKDFFARKQSHTFERAADTAVEALRRQVKRHKEKLKGL